MRSALRYPGLISISSADCGERAFNAIGMDHAPAKSIACRRIRPQRPLITYECCRKPFAVGALASTELNEVMSLATIWRELLVLGRLSRVLGHSLLLFIIRVDIILWGSHRAHHRIFEVRLLCSSVNPAAMK